VKRFAVPDLKPGDTIPLGGGNLRVVAVEWHERGRRGRGDASR
jgi:hypothetical protein